MPAVLLTSRLPSRTHHLLPCSVRDHRHYSLLITHNTHHCRLLLSSGGLAASKTLCHRYLPSVFRTASLIFSLVLVVHSVISSVTVNYNYNWGTCIAPPTRRPRTHHRVNPYPGARRQNETHASFEMSNATSCLLLRHVAGVEGAFDIRHVKWYKLPVGSTCCLLPFDMLLAWTGLYITSLLVTCL